MPVRTRNMRRRAASLLILPAELRINVYRKLFKGLTYCLDSSQEEPRLPEWIAEFNASTGILRTSRTVRREALAILCENVLLYTSDCKRVSRVPQFLRSAMTLKLDESPLDVNLVKSVLPHLQQLECSWLKTGSSYYYPLERKAFIAEMQGANDHVTIASIAHDTIIRDAVKTTAASQTKDHDLNTSGLMTKQYRDLPFSITIDLVCVVHTQRRTPDPNRYPPAVWLYGLKIDLKECKVKERRITTRVWYSETGLQLYESRPANEVAILHRGLSYPIVYHAKTGQKFLAYQVMGEGAQREKVRQRIEWELTQPGRFETALRDAAPCCKPE